MTTDISIENINNFLNSLYNEGSLINRLAALGLCLQVRGGRIDDFAVKGANTMYDLHRVSEDSAHDLADLIIALSQQLRWEAGRCDSLILIDEDWDRTEPKFLNGWARKRLVIEGLFRLLNREHEPGEYPYGLDPKVELVRNEVASMDAFVHTTVKDLGGFEIDEDIKDLLRLIEANETKDVWYTFEILSCDERELWEILTDEPLERVNLN